MIHLLSYWKNYVKEPGIIQDVFDSEWYHTLCQTDVEVDGVKQKYKFFSGKHDIVFSLSVDGCLLFNCRRSGPSATPILLMNLNLPPLI